MALRYTIVCGPSTVVSIVFHSLIGLIERAKAFVNV
jgi:hypothetical protein